MSQAVVMNKRKRTRPKWVGKGIGGCTVFALVGLVVLTGAYLLNNRPPDILIPTAALPNPNAYDDFVQAGKLAKAMKHPSPYSMPGTTAQTNTYANFKACALDAVPVQARVQVGLKKPYLCPPERSAKSMGFTSFALFRETARTLSGKARYENLSGHPGQAMDTLLDSYEMGVMIPRGGPLIAGLVGVAVEAISIRPMEEIIPRLSASELAHVAARLETIEAKRATYADILLEEGNVSTALLLEMFRDPKNRGFGANNFRDMFAMPGAQLTMQDRLMMLQLMFVNKEALLKHHQDYFKALAAEARQPYDGPSTAPTTGDPILSILAPTFQTARVKFVAIETVNLLLQTETALERFKRANGHYPQELAQLTPMFLKTVPIDLCAGKAKAPLRYQLRANGQDYLLYSIGEDRKDDGGKPKKFIGDGQPGDIVARHLWAQKVTPVVVPKNEALNRASD